MRKKSFLTIALLGLALQLTTFAASKHWLHIHVDSDDAEQVRVNLPMSLMETVLPILQDKDVIPTHLATEGIDMNGKKLTVSDMREIWNAVKAEGSFEMANVMSEDANIRVFIEDQHLMVQTDEQSGDKVNVKLPMAVVDALFSGEAEELNLAAALQALSNTGNQELVVVDSSDARVRVWIDESNTN